MRRLIITTMILVAAAGCSGDSVVIHTAAGCSSDSVVIHNSHGKSPLSMAILGEGFFQVRSVYKDVEVLAYTRVGNFTWNRNGVIVLGNSEGSQLHPMTSIPEDALYFEVTNDGRIIFQTPGDNTVQEAGQIELARFVNPDGLEQIRENLFIETYASGAPITGKPLESCFGEILGRSLELSNG